MSGLVMGLKRMQKYSIKLLSNNCVITQVYLLAEDDAHYGHALSWYAVPRSREWKIQARHQQGRIGGSDRFVRSQSQKTEIITRETKATAHQPLIVGKNNCRWTPPELCGWTHPLLSVRGASMWGHCRNRSGLGATGQRAFRWKKPPGCHG